MISINEASSVLKPVMFADDTNVFLSNKDIKKLSNDMNVELQKMSIWFIANNLSLNVIKTKQQKKIRLIEIARESVTKFLGIYIDENLTWKHHIEDIFDKVSKSIGITCKSRNILSKRLIELCKYC